MEEETFVFNKELYSDLTPITCPVPPVCSINYSDRFREAMGYFRALTEKNEYSERALLLTAVIIDLNSADYSAWYYRRRIIKSLPNYDIQKEYQFIEDLGDSICKNYQVWGHRQYLVGVTGDYMKELEFTNEMLEDDNKNYHCWSHRVWVCNKFNCWVGELEYTRKMIESDIRNNSAWSHRFHTYKILNLLGNKEKMMEELEFVESTFRQCSNNEAVWTYILGLFNIQTSDEMKALFSDFVSKIVEKRQFCCYAKICYVNIFKNTEKAIEYARELKDRLDVAHASYWEWFMQKNQIQ